MKCYICSNTKFIQVKGTVRDLPEIKILKCINCGLVFLENTDHIDNNYYEDFKMLEEGNLTIEKWSRENYTQNLRRADLLKTMIVNKKVLDFGCGEGGFLANIKPLVNVCGGIEKAKILRERITKKYNIHIFPDIKSVCGKMDVITIFHVLEHLKDPRKILRQLKDILSIDGTIIIETPNSDDALLTLYDNNEFQNFTYWGCHLFLYNSFNLNKLLEEVGFDVIYIKQLQRYPLSNHLYWLSKGKPGGHNIWGQFNSPELHSEYEKALAAQGKCDTLLAMARRKK